MVLRGQCYHIQSFIPFSSFTLAHLHKFFIFCLPKTCQLKYFYDLYYKFCVSQLTWHIILNTIDSV